MGRNARTGRAKSRRNPDPSSSTGRLGGVAAAIAVVAAAVFALGLELGGRRPQDAGASGDRLALLDDADRAAPPEPEPASLVFHDALTKDRPPDTLPVFATKPRPAKPAKEKPPRASEDEKAQAAATAKPAAPARPPPGPTPRIENSTWTAGVGVTPDGRWAIQLGASPNEGEARRIAARYAGARIVTADVDGKRWYRVRLKGFRTRPDAEAELSRLVREAGASGFVVAAAERPR